MASVAKVCQSHTHRDTWNINRAQHDYSSLSSENSGLLQYENASLAAANLGKIRSRVLVRLASDDGRAAPSWQVSAGRNLLSPAVLTGKLLFNGTMLRTHVHCWSWRFESFINSSGLGQNFPYFIPPHFRPVSPGSIKPPGKAYLIGRPDGLGCRWWVGLNHKPSPVFGKACLRSSSLLLLLFCSVVVHLERNSHSRALNFHQT
jgi:hypothetical protein